MDNCPSCGKPLRNGKDSKQMIEYDGVNPDSFMQKVKLLLGITDMSKINQNAVVYYLRDRLCFNPNCDMFAGNPNDAYDLNEYEYVNREKETDKRVKVDINNPRKVAGYIKIIDN